jgi:type II secretory pathway pseudopilin PulG
MRRRRGWALLEVVVASLLIAVALMVIAGLIPASVTSMKKAENIQAATLYATEVLEDARRPDFIPDASRRLWERKLDLNQIAFTVQREIYGVDGNEPPDLYDVVVKVTWEPQPVPVELRSRVYKQ